MHSYRHIIAEVIIPILHSHYTHAKFLLIVHEPGSDAETKALLYLMNFMPDSDEIYYFIVDFFNDLTGMDTMSTKLWDLQSKGDHNVGPKKIGKELVTLFKNYMSEFDFNAYIIFIGTVSSTV